jgi:uncharacterized membrane protein YeaQ/YmgE (transglycosylase-associated protein family)
VTIAVWIVIGAVVGLLSRIVMPVLGDRGNLMAVIVGVCSACIGGAAATTFLGGDLIFLNAMSITWSLVAALYTLFAYRCLALRGA